MRGRALQIGETRLGYVVVAVVRVERRDWGPLRIYQFACERCGRLIEAAASNLHSWRRCRCAGLPDPAEHVDRDLPFEDDGAAQRFVDERPAGAALADVARVMGVSTEWVRQIESIALRRVQAAIELARECAAHGISMEEVVRYLREARFPGDQTGSETTRRVAA